MSDTFAIVSTTDTPTKGKQMTEEEMIAKGFVLAPCANPACDVRFAGGAFCSICEEKQAKDHYTNG